MSVRGITMIALLKSGVSQEDAFCGFGEELVSSSCEIMNKTSTTKDTGRKKIERLVRKKEGMGNVVV